MPGLEISSCLSWHVKSSPISRCCETSRMHRFFSQYIVVGKYPKVHALCTGKEGNDNICNVPSSIHGFLEAKRKILTRYILYAQYLSTQNVSEHEQYVDGIKISRKGKNSNLSKAWCTISINHCLFLFYQYLGSALYCA